MHTITIRRAVINDVPALVKMRWDHIMSYAEYNQRPTVDRALFDTTCTRFLKEGIECGQWVIFIAQHQDSLIGHVYIQVIQKIPKPYELQGSWGYISNMYVEEPYRNQGVGKKLLDTVKEWAVNAELELLLLWPSEKSADFYRRNGFNSDATMQYTIKED